MPPKKKQSAQVVLVKTPGRNFPFIWQSAEWMPAMWAEVCSYHIPFQPRQRPHRPSNTDGCDKLSVKELKCFPHIRGENKHTEVRKQTRSTETPNTETNLHSGLPCLREKYLLHKHTLPQSPLSYATDTLTSDLAAASGASLPTLQLSFVDYYWQ